MNNTGRRDWEVNPLESAVPGASALRFLHKSCRVEVAIEPAARTIVGPEIGDQDVDYPVNVYEATTYDQDNDEFIDSGLVATVRPGQSGQGYSKRFLEANTLAVNAVLAIQEEDKWLSVPLNEPADSQEFNHL